MSAAALALPLFAATASATPASITCTGLFASASNGATLSGCSGNTGGGSDFVPESQFLNETVVIRWSNRVKTKVRDRVKQTARKLCPKGYLEVELTGTVRADHTGSTTAGNPVSATLCGQKPLGNPLTLAPGTTLTI